MADIICGDNVTITAYFEDANGNPVDITGATVTFLCTPPSGPGLSYPATVIDGPAGQAQYTLALTDTQGRPGRYIFQFSAVLPGTQTLTTQDGWFQARPRRGP